MIHDDARILHLFFKEGKRVFEIAREMNIGRMYIQAVIDREAEHNPSSAFVGVLPSNASVKMSPEDILRQANEDILEALRQEKRRALAASG